MSLAKYGNNQMSQNAVITLSKLTFYLIRAESMGVTPYA